MDNLYPERLGTVLLWNTRNPKHEIFTCLSYVQTGYETRTNSVNAKCQYSYHHGDIQSQCCPLGYLWPGEEGSEKLLISLATTEIKNKSPVIGNQTSISKHNLQFNSVIAVFSQSCLSSVATWWDYVFIFTFFLNSMKIILKIILKMILKMKKGKSNLFQHSFPPMCGREMIPYSCSFWLQNC